MLAGSKVLPEKEALVVVRGTVTPDHGRLFDCSRGYAIPWIGLRETLPVPIRPATAKSRHPGVFSCGRPPLRSRRGSFTSQMTLQPSSWSAAFSVYWCVRETAYWWIRMQESIVCALLDQGSIGMHAVQAASDQGPRVGLVLGGGGVRGAVSTQQLFRLWRSIVGGMLVPQIWSLGLRRER
jgi:hypothetical protein